MSLKNYDVERIERKLDLILDALGLTDNRRMSPSEIKEIASSIILQYRKKRANCQLHECKKS
jgi:hypothetical protein